MHYFTNILRKIRKKLNCSKVTSHSLNSYFRIVLLNTYKTNIYWGIQIHCDSKIAWSSAKCLEGTLIPIHIIHLKTHHLQQFSSTIQFLLSFSAQTDNRRPCFAVIGSLPSLPAPATETSHYPTIQFLLMQREINRFHIIRLNPFQTQ